MVGLYLNQNGRFLYQSLKESYTVLALSFFHYVLPRGDMVVLMNSNTQLTAILGRGPGVLCLPLVMDSHKLLRNHQRLLSRFTVRFLLQRPTIPVSMVSYQI